jgi:predicted transcriptional regulator
MNAIATIDTTKNDAESSKSLAEAKSLIITTEADYKKADSFCKGLFNLRKAIENDFAESLDAADEAKRAATAAKAALVEQIESHTKPVQEAERITKTKMFAWSKEQEDLRRKEQDRLRAEAFKKAEDERIKKAEALQAKGKTEQAMAEIEKPVKAAPVILPPAPTERETVISGYWSYKIINPSEVKRDFCKPDPGVIQASMNAYKKQGKSIEEVMERIGGIIIEEKVK